MSYAGGFYFNNIAIKKYHTTNLIYITGDITNDSNKDYNTAAFRVSVCDDKTMVWTGVVKIRGFKKKQNKSFELPLENADFNEKSSAIKCEMCFDGGF